MCAHCVCTYITFLSSTSKAAYVSQTIYEEHRTCLEPIHGREPSLEGGSRTCTGGKLGVEGRNAGMKGRTEA